MSSRNEPVEFYDVLLKHKTDRAYLCLIDGEEHWIPISQIVWKKTVPDVGEVVTDIREIGDVGNLTIPHWICMEKGLI